MYLIAKTQQVSSGELTNIHPDIYPPLIAELLNNQRAKVAEVPTIIPNPEGRSNIKYWEIFLVDDYMLTFDPRSMTLPGKNDGKILPANTVIAHVDIPSSKISKKHTVSEIEFPVETEWQVN